MARYDAAVTSSEDTRPLMSVSLPTLTAALKPSLLREGEPALSAQVDVARIHALCYCGEPDCLTFFLAPPDESPCIGAYRVVMPDAVMTIGVCNEQMWRVEDDTNGRQDERTRAKVAEYGALRSRVARAPW